MTFDSYKKGTTIWTPLHPFGLLSNWEGKAKANFVDFLGARTIHHHLYLQC